MIEVLKGIGKRKVFYLLILLQFSFSMLYFFIAASSIQKVFYTNIEVPRNLDVETDELIHVEIDAFTDKESFENFEADICSNGVQAIGTYRVGAMYSTKLGGDVATVEVDANIKKMKDIELKDGEYFSAADFKYTDLYGSAENPIPILVGANIYEECHLEIGDVVYDMLQQRYYKVKAVIKEGSKWFYQNVSDGMILSLDKQIVLPVLENDYLKIHYYAIIPHGADSEKVIRYMEQSADYHDITMGATSVSDELQIKFDESYIENQYWLIFAVIILFMISIGTAILFVTLMDSRKYEIGIRIAVGYSMGKVIKQLILEVFLVDVSAYIIAVVCGRMILGNGINYFMAMEYSDGYYLSLDIILMGVGVMCIMCVPAIIMVWIRARRLQPRELIGGNE